MRYPLKNATSIPNSGNAFYIFLLENLSIPAKASHQIWYNGCKKLLNNPDEAFRGFFPVGKTLLISYANSPLSDYTFTGNEKNPVYVRDLSIKAKLELGISSKCRDSDKVFNPFFRSYEELPEKMRKDNELPALSLAKSITSYFSENVLFSEKDVVDMLTSALQNSNSKAMRHILHGNHIAWCASRFLSRDILEEDIKKNFYSQNDINFYIKDIGTIIPAIFFSLANLGVNPLQVIELLDYDLWGIKDVAIEMKNYMFEYKKSVLVA